MSTASRTSVKRLATTLPSMLYLQRSHEFRKNLARGRSALRPPKALQKICEVTCEAQRVYTMYLQGAVRREDATREMGQ